MLVFWNQIRRIDLALSEFTVYEIRTTGSNNNGGGFVWFPIRTSAYKFTLSASGTNEYYLELAAGGDPSIAACNSLYLDGWFNLATKGTAGSLTAGQWDYTDNDTLGYNTPYVRLADDSDPDTKGLNFVAIGKGGGVDYSQQAASQASFTNLSTDVAGTQLTDADAGGLFTALMVGNIIYIRSGTGFSVGWYEIVTFIDANNVTIDRSAGSSATAGSGEVGGARALQDDPFFENGVVAGNSVFFEGPGTFTSVSSMSVARDGTPTKYIKIAGYNTTRGDAPTGTNRPLIAAGANIFLFDDYYEFKHLRLTGTGTVLIRADAGGYFENIYANNSSVSSNRPAIIASGSLGSTVVDCEAESVNGRGIATTNGTNILNCIVHDSVTGIDCTNTGTAVVGCLVYDCDRGINANQRAIAIINTTIDNCVNEGIWVSTGGTTFTIRYNILSNCGTAILLTTAKDSIDVDWNNFYNNTTDYTVDTMKIGENNSSLNPEYVGSPDFETSSNMTIAITYKDGTNSSSFKMGAIQTEAAGNGETSYGSVT
jgi:hypothetical protein